MQETIAGNLFEIQIPWHNQDNNWWNETCAVVVEVFGLPGERYTYHPQYEDMRFIFKSKKDAELCRILLSEKL
jgi:hypothetical protein